MTRLFLLAFFITLSALGRTQSTIYGQLSDQEGNAIIGANIFLEGTYDGTSSNLEGQFTFVSTEMGNFNLQITYLGYRTLIIPIELNNDTIQVDTFLSQESSSIEMVTISAGAFEASDEKKSVMLKPLDIVTTAGATADIAGALNTLPGTQAVGETGQLFVRGGASGEAITMIDGMYVQNPYASSVPNVPARNRFSPFLFKGTTFSTGAYSAEYGQALSAALVLHTQDLAPETQTSLSFMSVGLGAAHTQRWEKSSLAISADYTNLGPYVNLVPQNINWDKAPTGKSGQLVFRQKTSQTGLLKVMGNFSRNGFRMQYPLNEQADQLTSLNLNNDNLYINTTYQDILPREWGLKVGFAHGNNVDQIEQNFDFQERQRSTEFKVKLSKEIWEHVQLRVGSALLNAAYDESFQELDAPFPFETKLVDRLASVFTEVDIYWTPKLVSRIGLRGESSSLLNTQYLAPRVSLAYKTGENAQISLAAGQFQQRAAWQDLRFDRPEGPEVAQHYLLNYQITGNQRTFRIETYYKNYERLLLFEENTTQNVNNDGQGYAKGIDVFYRDQKSLPYTDFWIAYSYLDTERQFRDFPELATPRFASKHNLSLVYKRWIPGWNAQLGLTYRVASPRPYDDPNTPVFQDKMMPTYQDLSFNASFLTQFFHQFTIVYVSVSNLMGWKQEFGERFSSTPNEAGQFTSTNITTPAKRMVFLGVFISIK